ncbi:MAG TPA: SAM-dependent methyltransferase [Verrucomicrobiae bacterium]|nr:SAM-dependent methyltransferase [Verrucomicrobiae bacterium]
MRIADRIPADFDLPSAITRSTHQDVENPSRQLPLLSPLLLLFFATGCAALIYEVVWFQLLQLVIGLGNVSLAVVLGTYMGGMCLGSLFVTRLVPRRFHPLRVYAMIELLIALCGVALLFLIPAIAEFYTEFMGRGLPSLLLRAFFAGICLLPPTVLMGATLPVLSRSVEHRHNAASWIGFFYTANIVGAVFGCLLAGFYLLRVFDSATAAYVAAGINTAVAIASVLLAIVIKPSAPAVEVALERPDASSEENRSALSPQTHFPIYLALGLSGMSALGAEVVWTRLLSLVLGGTVYTFSIVLAVFLLGLGLGSGLGSVWSRLMKRPSVAFSLCQALLAIAIGWSAYAIARSLPYWPVNPSISLSPWFNFQLDIARCLWAVLPAAILWGASFPLALAAIQSSQEDSAAAVGRLYAANTLGAIVGALLFTLVVIPVAGTHHAEQILIAIAALSGMLLLFSTDQTTEPHLPQFRPPRLIGACALIAISALLILNVSPAPWGLAAYGRFMATYGRRLAPFIVDEKDVPTNGGWPDIFCTYHGEGLNGTVAVTKWKSGQRSFHSAGKVQASNEAQDMRLQRMLGHISALVHEKPESVLVVACGAGVTAGSFVVHPEVKRIVICDIEPLVPKHVAPLFKQENYDVVNDPRTELVFDDGRHFVRTTKEKFDVITSDPIDPWVKGCAALNTVEYYQMCKEHLKPGGVMSLWIPLYESNSEATKTLIATFFQVFPNGILWSNELDGEGYDAVLFGQAEPTHIDVDALQERLDRPDHARVRQSLAEVGFRTAVSLLSTYAGRALDLREWMRNAQINTDKNLRLQYLAGMWFNSYVESDILDDITRYRKFPESVFVGTQGRREMLRMFFDQNVKNK